MERKLILNTTEKGKKGILIIISVIFCILLIVANNASAFDLGLGDLITDGISSLFKGKDKQVEVTEISLGVPTSTEVVKGSTLIIPSIIWHVYEEDAFSATVNTIVNNVHSNIKTIPYLNNIQPTNELKEKFSSNLNDFKTKYFSHHGLL
ncbi:MAG: hypothetical protein AAB331_01785 [Planctomycetota bacterium]